MAFREDCSLDLYTRMAFREDYEVFRPDGYPLRKSERAKKVQTYLARAQAVRTPHNVFFSKVTFRMFSRLHVHLFVCHMLL
jgi:hypothetical protein